MGKPKVIPKKTVQARPLNYPNMAATAMKAETTPLDPTDYPPAPEVLYTPKAWHTLWHLVDTCKQEVGWLGLVEWVDEENAYLITEIVIPEQTVHGTETDISSDAMAVEVERLINEGKDPSQLRYWGHSHVNMSVGPSATDEDQIDEYLEHANWFIRGIYNKRREAKVDVFDTTEGVVYQCVKHGIASEGLTDEELTALNDTIKANVKQRRYPPYGTVYTYPGNRVSPRNVNGHGRVPGALYDGYGGYVWLDDEDDFADKLADPFFVGGD